MIKEKNYQIFCKNTKDFDRTRGVYPHTKLHIEINEAAEPAHSRLYPVPQVHLDTFKK